ncbi:hypothetical protein KY326_00400 [Candidatus Woesearchaeota archaeon]|nr:hypothetical protein [Candidatus Woesearchaeota archaeon]
MKTESLLYPLVAVLIVVMIVIIIFSVKNLASEDIPVAEEVKQDLEDIYINLNYNQESDYDPDNNGVESSSGIIDFTVKDSIVFEQENLCTLWTVHSEETGKKTYICNGAQHCCLLFDLKPAVNEWNVTFDLFYGRYDATENNIISASIAYVSPDMNMIMQSNESSLPARFILSESYGMVLDKERYYLGDEVELTFNLGDARFVYLDLRKDGTSLRLSNQLTDNKKKFKANIPGNYRFVAGLEINDTLIEIEKEFSIS